MYKALVSAPLQQAAWLLWLIGVVRLATWLGQANPAPGSVYDAALAAFEHPLFVEVLKSTGGNQFQAARVLGINRNTLRKRLVELEIDPDAFARR